MRNNYQRHLSYLETPEKRNENIHSIAKILPGKKEIVIPPEFNAKDWMTFLLHIDSELEHSLMVQYLYAAYSLNGDQKDDNDRQIIRKWQEIILGVAKEEMGHFISIQNVLRVIGAPLNFNRQDFPWDSTLYPFEFKLEPLTKSSLAKYIYAESPKNWLTKTEGDDDETKEIKKEIIKMLSSDKKGDPISVLFEKIIALLSDEILIPDEIFLPETFPYQAKFDEWGRGYSAGARGNNTNGNPQRTPDVLVTPLISRTDAINAIKEIGEQGEATSDDESNPSHFKRFLGIYKEWRKMPTTFTAARPLATNPTISDEESSPPSSLDSKSKEKKDDRDIITDQQARAWANLFNVRYRMLLTFLTHSFLIGDGFDNSSNTARGAIIHATFGEMYNLRSIANVLVKLPLSKDSKIMCGPPFQLPYTMDLPIGEKNRWRVHKDLINASNDLISSLLIVSDSSLHKYLYSLREVDNKFDETANKIIEAVV